MSNPEIEEIPIRDDMIRLGQLLKLASLVEDGVEATELIRNGWSRSTETSTTAAAVSSTYGDTVTVNGQTVRISTARRVQTLNLLSSSTLWVRNSATWPISCWLMPCHIPV